MRYFFLNVGKFIFTFGRNPDLSYLELISVLKTLEISFKFSSILTNSVVVDFDNINQGNPKSLIGRLAGTTKISEVRLISPFDSLDSAVAEYPYEYSKKRKWRFSLDLQSDSFQDEQALRSFRSWIKGIIKRVASEKGIKAEYEDLSLSELFKSKCNIVDRRNHSHFVIHIDKLKENVYISDEHEYSNPMEFKEKTDKRPYKDFRITSSFRLSRILVNLSGAKIGQLLLDPFCGLGTILCEGLSIGCNVIGVELNPDRVKHARKNCDWYKHKYLLNSNLSFRILEGDSTKLSQVLARENIGYVDYIISEPELGPLLDGRPTVAEAKTYVQLLEPLYSQFFEEAHKILGDNGKIVIILPEFEAQDGTKYGLTISTLEKFKIVNPTEGYEKYLEIPLECSEEWNYLNRMLYILEKK